MNMYIVPRYLKDTGKSNWVSRLWRALGVVQIIASIAAGLFFLPPYLALFLSQFTDLDAQSAVTISQLIGLVVGILVGLFTSLAFWTLAQILDNLRDIRIHTCAYVALEDENAHIK